MTSPKEMEIFHWQVLILYILKLKLETYYSLNSQANRSPKWWPQKKSSVQGPIQISSSVYYTMEAHIITLGWGPHRSTSDSDCTQGHMNDVFSVPCCLWWLMRSRENAFGQMPHCFVWNISLTASLYCEKRLQNIFGDIWWSWGCRRGAANKVAV